MNKMILALVAASISVWAADFRSMSTEELQAMRGSVPADEKAAFQSEMQSRLQSMSSEERQAATASMKQSKSGPADGTGSQMRQGGGMSGSMGGSMGSGMGGGGHFRGGR